jgi:hypothetical protein
MSALRLLGPMLTRAMLSCRLGSLGVRFDAKKNLLTAYYGGEELRFLPRKRISFFL